MLAIDNRRNPRILPNLRSAGPRARTENCDCTQGKSNGRCRGGQRRDIPDTVGAMPNIHERTHSPELPARTLRLRDRPGPKTCSLSGKQGGDPKEQHWRGCRLRSNPIRNRGKRYAFRPTQTISLAAKTNFKTLAIRHAREIPECAKDNPCSIFAIRHNLAGEQVAGTSN